LRVSISGDLERFVRQLVADGDYKSADKLVAKALTDFAHAHLRKEIELGSKGPFSDWDVNEEKRRLLRRLNRQKKATQRR